MSHSEGEKSTNTRIDAALLAKAVDIAKSIYKRLASEKLRELAEDYILTQYAPVGQRLYYWEEGEDETDDTTVYSPSPIPPDDTDNYYWSEVVSNSVISSRVTEFNDAVNEYTVEVNILAAFKYGSAENQLEAVEELEPDGFTVWVDFEKDEEGDFVVVDVTQ